MAMRTAFVVQPFEVHRKRLRPARQEPAQTESGAVKKAENMAKRMPGAAAPKVLADETVGPDVITIIANGARSRRSRRELAGWLTIGDVGVMRADELAVAGRELLIASAKRHIAQGEVERRRRGAPAETYSRLPDVGDVSPSPACT